MVSFMQELDDGDLCVEFAHFLSNFITLERKKKLTKTKTWCLAIIDTDASFVSRVVSEHAR